MSLFQIIGLVVTGALSLSTLRRIRYASLASTVLWFGVWASAFVAFLVPDATTRVASLLGIKRGVELVLYVAALMSFAGLYALSARVRTQERHITELVRRLAIIEAKAEDHRAPPEGTPSTSEPRTP